MSIALMTEVWKSELPMTEKMVLLCLADFANDRGECWPAIDTIATKCSCSDRTVQKAIKCLREWGLLTVTDTPGRPHSYAINPRISFTPEKSSPPKNSAKGVKNIHPGGEARSPKPSMNHQEPSVSCATDAAPALKPEHIFEEWNARLVKLGKRAVRDLTPERRQLLKARIGQYPIDDFLDVFGKIERSPFLRGDTGWHGCNFDWVFKKANFQKILEGNYDQ